MRILHTADWHLGDRLGRINRTPDLRRAVERVAGYCEEHSVDVLLVAGDLFSELSRADGLRDSVQHLQDVFLPFLLKGGTILALTGNHDNENFCQTLCSVMSLAAPPGPHVSEGLPPGRLYLAASPTLLRLADRTGTPVQFLMMPYPFPARYLDEPAQRYPSVEEKNRNLLAAFAGKLHAFPDHPDFSPELPTVLAAHIHVRGAVLPGLFRISEQENIIFPEPDSLARFAYVALGHIHQPQSLLGMSHVRYSGSIERLDLGEWRDGKGVVLLDVGPDGLLDEPVLLPLEATPFYEVVITNPREELPGLADRYPDADQALVRLDLTYTAGTDNLDALLRELDRTFPRWYTRSWREAGALRAAEPRPGPAAPSRGVPETVLEYLETELAGDPDREAVLQLAQALLAEERR